MRTGPRCDDWTALTPPRGHITLHSKENRAEGSTDRPQVMASVRVAVRVRPVNKRWIDWLLLFCPSFSKETLNRDTLPSRFHREKQLSSKVIIRVNGSTTSIYKVVVCFFQSPNQNALHFIKFLLRVRVYLFDFCCCFV